MKTFTHELPSSVVFEMYRRARAAGIFDGTEATTEVIRHCTAIHYATGTILIFTREEGYHSGGWWKNPDYERCYHLSLSFRDNLSGRYVPFDKKQARAWLDAFFTKENQRKLWVEGPGTKEGKEGDVHHYRLFCDADWNPIIPRGEVYSKQFTELGWKSFSEVHEEVEPS